MQQLKHKEYFEASVWSYCVLHVLGNWSQDMVSMS